jgi:hypothetical protein
MTIGMLRTAYTVAAMGFSSTLHRTTRRVSATASAASAKHGSASAHAFAQGAQNSTSTGVEDLKTVSAKVVSVTSEMLARAAPSRHSRGFYARDSIPCRTTPGPKRGWTRGTDGRR